jgi:hypothetical protein
MQTTLLYGNLRPVEKVFVAFKNNELTAMLRGVPVVYQFNGTNDGIAAINAVTAGANAATAGFAGINSAQVAPGAWGLAQCYGLCDFVVCSGATPALSVLGVNVAANNMLNGGLLSAIIAIATSGPVALPPIVTINAAATVNGIANVAKAFLRCM